jgi:hypothetical protein
MPNQQAEVSASAVEPVPSSAATLGAQPASSLNPLDGMQALSRGPGEGPEDLRLSTSVPDTAPTSVLEPTPAYISAPAGNQASASVSQRLRCATRVTQLPRILLALVMAQLLFSETLLTAQLRLPPLLVLAVLQVGGTSWFPHRSSVHCRLTSPSCLCYQVSIIYATLQLLRVPAVGSLLVCAHLLTLRCILNSCLSHCCQS